MTNLAQNWLRNMEQVLPPTLYHHPRWQQYRPIILASPSSFQDASVATVIDDWLWGAVLVHGRSLCPHRSGVVAYWQHLVRERKMPKEEIDGAPYWLNKVRIAVRNEEYVLSAHILVTELSRLRKNSNNVKDQWLKMKIFETVKHISEATDQPGQ